MECRACGQDLSGVEHRMVAEWPFCLQCFERLLERPSPAAVEESTPAPAPPKTEASPAPAPEAGPVCMLCGRSVAGRDHATLGPVVVCEECIEGLGSISGPEAEPPPAPEADEPPEKVAVEPRRYVNCTSCGRRIPEGGSKSQGDQPYCPDCFRSLPAEVQAAPPAPEPSPPDDGPADLSGDVAAEHCDCCQRLPHPGTVEVREGFVLCQACLSTDPQASVEIARARHRKRMEQLKRDLDAP